MPKNLLVADDSITIQKVVGITFAGEDFRITAVDNGDDALSRARELKPDLILADVVMPRKNGYEVCEAIKADPALRHIPVLLLAGTFEAFDEARARLVHADAHIAKPFESQALLTKVKELLERPGQPAVPVQAAAPVKPPAPPPPAAAARPPPARPPPGTPPPARPLGAAPQVSRPLTQPTAPGPVSTARPAGAPPLARPPAGPPPAVRPPAGAAPSVAPKRAAPPFSPPIVVRPPAGPPPAARPAMPPPPPPAPPVAAVVARDPFGLGEAPAAAPRAAAVSDDLDVDWSEDGSSAAPPPAETAPLANARVVALEELYFEPANDGPGTAAAVEAIELPDAGPSEELELAPASDFIPSAETTGHPPEPASLEMELDFEPLAPAAEEQPLDLGPAAPAGDGGEAQLRQALSQASREVIERIAWEVVPQLAETIIREQLERLAKERQR